LGNVVKPLDIAAMIDYDYSYDFTPDLTALRFLGTSIPVFLWDNLQRYPDLKEVMGDLGISKHYVTKELTVKTVPEFIPLIASVRKNEDLHAAYMLRNSAHLKHIYQGDAKPLPVDGKYLRVSLAALQVLDAHYRNTEDFTRRLVQVRCPRDKSIINCYTWMNSLNQIATFDAKEQQHAIIDGLELEVARSIQFSTGSKCYRTFT
jgi:hypothetical protein